MKFSKKLQEFIYALSTNDKYSDFDSTKSFNRLNKPDETNLLYAYRNQSSVSLTRGSGELSLPGSSGASAGAGAMVGIHETRLAWRHIKSWLSKYSPDLSSSLQSKCTDSDLAEFQQDLNIVMPACLVEFYKLTDGQAYMNDSGPGGLFFGLKLLPIDEVMVTTEHWRKIAKYLNTQTSVPKDVERLAKLEEIHTNSNNHIKDNSEVDLIDSLRVSLQKSDKSDTNAHLPPQYSVPPSRIRPCFAHPLWIPLITDEVGNYIGVDLCPPTTGDGIVGQVILFGREFDCKYLIADNFGDFLLIFANDLEIGNWDIKTEGDTNDEDIMVGSDGELVFVDKKTQEEMPYLEVLKRRSIDNWISAFKNNNQDVTDEDRQLLSKLQVNKKPLTLKNSTDEFINKNLDSLGTIYQSQDQSID